LRDLKRRLEKAKGNWLEEIPRILWSYHTTPQSTTKETPFSLVYGSDAMIPVEEQKNSPRFQSFFVEESNEGRRMTLDLLEEARDHVRINSKAFKRRVELRHKTKTKPQQFKIVDFVMTKTHPYQIDNKLSTKWIGPFCVVEVDEDLGERAPTGQAQPMTSTPTITHRNTRSRAQTLGVKHQLVSLFVISVE